MNNNILLLYYNNIYYYKFNLYIKLQSVFKLKVVEIYWSLYFPENYYLLTACILYTSIIY